MFYKTNELEELHHTATYVTPLIGQLHMGINYIRVRMTDVNKIYLLNKEKKKIVLCRFNFDVCQMEIRALFRNDKYQN